MVRSTRRSDQRSLPQACHRPTGPITIFHVGSDPRSEDGDNNSTVLKTRKGGNAAAAAIRGMHNTKYVLGT